MKREGFNERVSKETRVLVSWNLDTRKEPEINTGIGFFDHMLTLLAVHGQFGLNVKAQGDVEVDVHHTIEDVGIVLGKAFRSALGDRAGINRYATMHIPMDEAMAVVSIDISGRPYLHMDLPEISHRVGNFDTECLEDFFRAFSVNAGLTLHINVLYGRNTHHIIEAIFKALGRSLKKAAMIVSDDGVPSSKGLLD